MGYRHIVVPLVLLLVFAALPEGFTTPLRYERDSLGQLHLWRLLSAPWVSLGLIHALMNGAALVLLWWLARGQWRASLWWLALIGLGVLVHVGLWFFSPSITWAVGLSGVLHGLAVLVIARHPGLLWQVRTIAIVALLAKVLLEQLALFPSASGALIGGRVLVDAHLYGALAGLGILALQLILPFAECRLTAQAAKR